MLVRVIVLGLAAVSLSGCLPPALQLVSWTATGLSYVFSGKGPSDHALSLAAEKDCATWRILKGEDICVEYKKEYKNGWEAVADTFHVPGTDSEQLASATIPATSDIEGEVLAFTSGGIQPLTSEEQTIVQVAADISMSPEQLEAIAPAAGSAKPLPINDAVVARVSAAPEDVKFPVDALSDINREIIFLVVGSFSNDAHAKRLQSNHKSLPMRIWNTQVGGKAVYRVLAGPVQQSELKVARVDLDKAGLRNSWAVKLCRASLSPPPCSVEPLQQANAAPIN